MRTGPVFGTSAAPFFLLFVAAVATISISAAFAADRSAPANVAGTFVIVSRAVQGCFFDTVRVSGYLVPRHEMQIPFEAEGYRITEVSAAEGDTVASGQQLAKLVQVSGAQQPSANTQPVIIRSPVAGLVTKVSAAVGLVASPRAEPLFRIAVDGTIELEAEVPGTQLSKLKPEESARVEVGTAPEIAGRVRRAMIELNPATQLGRVRIA